MQVLSRVVWLFTALLLFFVQCARDKNIIAEVGSLKITIAEYRKELKKSYPHQNLKEVSLEGKKAVLDRMVELKKKLNSAYDLDLDQDPKIISTIQNQRNRIIGNKYYEKVIVDRFVTEEVIKSYLEKQKGENPGMDYANDETGLQIIKQKLYQAYSDSARLLWNKHSQELKTKYSYRLNNDTVDKIATMIGDLSETEKLDLNSFSPEQLESVLASWDDGRIELQDILRRYGARLSSVLPRFRNSKALAREADIQALMQIILRDAKRYNIEEDAQIEAEITANLETMLVHLVEKKVIEENVTFSEDDVLAYYQKNPEKFVKPEEIEIWEIYVEDENLAKSILEQAKAGHDFSKLAQKYSQDKSYASKGGYLGYRYIKGRGAVSQEAFKLGPGGKIGGPVKYRKGWVVLKTGAKNEKSIKSFESVKKLAESYVHNERIINNRVQWEKELNEKYAVKIYNDKLEEI